MAENKDKQEKTANRFFSTNKPLWYYEFNHPLFYFAVLVVLVYLYSYSGIGAAKFIYKDF